MLHTGLVSITFRQYSPKEIIGLVCKAELDAVEWGGDIHVPHKNYIAAKEVSERTLSSGLKIAAYGSYYRVGCENLEFDNFKTVVETAVNLKAPIIRVWAGEKGSKESDSDYFQKIIETGRIIADIALDAEISVSFEFHKQTLTDTNESAYKLLNSISNDNIKTFWQPNQFMSIKERMDGLKRIGDWLTNIHVFNWTLDAEGHEVRLALQKGIKEWESYIKYVTELDGERFALIEFVKGDCIEQFMKDAKILNRLVK